jgi:ornithine carbamoyltransferase
MDITTDEFTAILKKTAELKAEIKKGKQPDVLKGKVVAMLFEKPSTRTRASFESAILRLCGKAVYLPSADLQLKRGEPVKDTARMFGGYFDGLVARVYQHKTIRELVEFSGLSVINGLCNKAHPTQAICDLFTIMEVKKDLKGRKLAYIGDGNNVCNSLLLACAHSGMHISVARPEGYDPDAVFLAEASKIAKNTGATIEITTDPTWAAKEADILYTDTWISMGEDAEKEKKLRDFQGYQINEGLIGLAAKDVSVMHCLPAYRELEITEQALEGSHSVVWQQGENKMYAACGVLDFFLG